MCSMRWFYFLFAIHSMNVSLSNQFELALKAHNEQQYQQAFDLYCAMPVKTFTVMFNMGLTAYYEGHYPKAIAFWRKACFLNTLLHGYSGLKRISCAITQLKNEQSVVAEWAGHPADSSQFFYHILFLITWYMHVIPVWMIQILTIIISLTIACCIWNISQKRAFFWRYFCVMLLLAVLLSFMVHVVKIRTASYAIIHENIAMRHGPGDFFEEVGSLCPLVELLIEKKALSWCKVRYQDTVGWVPVRALYFIDDHTTCGIHIVNAEQ